MGVGGNLEGGGGPQLQGPHRSRQPGPMAGGGRSIGPGHLSSLPPWDISEGHCSPAVGVCSSPSALHLLLLYPKITLEKSSCPVYSL